VAWYLVEPLLFLLVFLAAPVAAWGLARRWTPAVAPPLLVVVVAVIAANVLAPIVLRSFSAGAGGAVSTVGQRLADASLRVVLLFLVGVLATLAHRDRDDAANT
jgi:hypothetical protein